MALLLLIGGRAAFVQWKNRQLVQRAGILEAKVQQLSLRPPAGPAPVTLQLAPYPGLPSLMPIAITPTPADAASSEKNAKTASGPGPSEPDPDYADPGHDEP